MIFLKTASFIIQYPEKPLAELRVILTQNYTFLIQKASNLRPFDFSVAREGIEPPSASGGYQPDERFEPINSAQIHSRPLPAFNSFSLQRAASLVGNDSI